MSRFRNRKEIAEGVATALPLTFGAVANLDPVLHERVMNELTLLLTHHGTAVAGMRTYEDVLKTYRRTGDIARLKKIIEALP